MGGYSGELTMNGVCILLLSMILASFSGLPCTRREHELGVQAHRFVKVQRSSRSVPVARLSLVRKHGCLRAFSGLPSLSQAHEPNNTLDTDGHVRWRPC